MTNTLGTKLDIRSAIERGKTALGVELGSTRIKAVLIGEDYTPIASGSYEWENRYENGVWTYSLEDVWTGLQESYRRLSREVLENYDTPLQTIGAIGFSAMMHGYMAFDKDGNLLVPFRTWRNTITGKAAKKLTGLFQFNIPQRWSIAHLYQAIMNKEPHVKDINHQTTLAGYVHWKLTGNKVLGVGEASGMFPIDSRTNSKQKRSPGNSRTFSPRSWWLERLLAFSLKKAPNCLIPRVNSELGSRSAHPKATRALAWLRPTASQSEPAMSPREPPSLP